MKVAAAMTAMDTTLRAGRYEALRMPRRDSDHQPWPESVDRGGLPSQNAAPARAAARSSAPAPKNATESATRSTEPSNNSNRDTR